MRKRGAGWILLLAAAVLLTGCSQEADTAGSGRLLSVGVRKNLANFSTYNEEADTYYGFEDALAEALADRLGYDGVSYTGLDPEDRETVLKSGQIDCLIAAFSYTDERAAAFNLSDPYYYDSGRVMVERSTLFTDYGDLEGSRVAVRAGTDAKEQLADALTEESLISDAAEIDSFLEIVEYDRYEEMDQALEYGDVDALCADGCITLPWLDEERAYFAEPYSEEKYVIATAQGSTLTAQINEALAELTADGTLAELENMWGIANEETE